MHVLLQAVESTYVFSVHTCMSCLSAAEPIKVVYVKTSSQYHILKRFTGQVDASPDGFEGTDVVVVADSLTCVHAEHCSDAGGDSAELPYIQEAHTL